MKLKQFSIRTLTLLFALLVSSACGLKGDLYIPEEKPVLVNPNEKINLNDEAHNTTHDTADDTVNTKSGVSDEALAKDDTNKDDTNKDEMKNIEKTPENDKGLHYQPTVPPQ